MKATGVRLGEALRLEHHQVLRAERLAVISHFTKSKRWRVVPLPDEALEAIDAMPVHPTCPAVFWNPGTGLRWVCPRKLIDKARHAAGMPWFQIKDLRREYGIKLAESGAELHVIQACLGHSSVKTTEDYYAQFSRAWAARKALVVLQGVKAPGNDAPFDRP
jgi:integrase